MRKLDVDLETDRTYSGIVGSDFYEKGGMGYNIKRCTEATKLKFGKSANENNPTPEQKEFMLTCLKGKKQNNKVIEETNEVKEVNSNNILIYSAVGLAFVAMYMWVVKR
jgi:hypothetical protein